jgi:hypothetical protein
MTIAIAASGCRKPTDLAGESIGQYRVVGALAENECAGGHPAPPDLTFYVELRSEPGSARGYWKLPDGPLVAGALDPDGAFRFAQSANVTAVPADPARGVTGCVLERAEVVSGALEMSASDASAIDGGVADDVERIDGTTAITIAPVAGSDCSPILTAWGGAFPALPCRILYDLDGERLAEPLW